DAQVAGAQPLNKNMAHASAANPKYELRGAWIATVVNIDWPSEKGLPAAQQKQEYIAKLDSLQRLNINAVFVQVRPAADAFYPSQYEPWSEYLSGTQGVAPSPYYDPLQFMIDEAHKRNMEFHAWLNPYRAVFKIGESSIASNHITKKHPEWFVVYGGKKYFNPGLPAVMQFVTNVVKDIVTRYDVDGIHADDYFYPYRIKGKEFPDNSAYLKYGKGYSKDAWRRNNCDSIIKMIHDAIETTKPKIKFGISPFGVWRNKDKDPDGSNTTAGQTNYDDLYADILLWLQKGWIDYVAPQLYWEIGNKYCDYNTLIAWWAEHTYSKQLYIGHGLYRVFESPTPAWRNKSELPDEINELRNYSSVQGSIFFSCKDLLRNPNGWYDSLQFNYYNSPSLVPPMEWIDNVPPKKPSVVNLTEYKKGSYPGFTLHIKANTKNETQQIKTYVIYLTDNIVTLGQHPSILFAKVTDAEQDINIGEAEIPSDWQHCFIAVSALDKENNESELSNVVQLIHSEKGWKIPK
ncbi:MAG TPA: family 10 glycosylhydrolase, partial [Chitinophagaceae bacterium]|nr:family 10 glycosylhydrolase [Chitinophagaceae bacterium]